MTAEEMRSRPSQGICILRGIRAPGTERPTPASSCSPSSVPSEPLPQACPSPLPCLVSRLRSLIPILWDDHHGNPHPGSCPLNTSQEHTGSYTASPALTEPALNLQSLVPESVFAATSQYCLSRTFKSKCLIFQNIQLGFYFKILIPLIHLFKT